MKNISFPDEPFPKSMANKSFPLGTIPFSSNSSSMSSSSSSSSSIRSGGPNPFKDQKSVPPSLLPPSLSSFGKPQNKTLAPQRPSGIPISPSVTPAAKNPTLVIAKSPPPVVIPTVAPTSSQGPPSNVPQRGEKTDRILGNTERISYNVEFIINKLNELSQLVSVLKIAEQNREIGVLKEEMDLLKRESEQYKGEIEGLKLKIKKSKEYKQEIEELKLKVEKLERLRQDVDDNKKCDTDTDEEAKVEDEKEEAKVEEPVEVKVEEQVEELDEDE